MIDPVERQAIIDAEHLKMLSLGFFIAAALNAFMSLFGLFYIFMGVFMGSAFSHLPPTGRGDQPPPELFFWLFGGIGALFFLGFLTVGALKLRAGSCLKQHKSRTFCIVVAAISCLEVPFGTALGVLCIIVLGRASVMRLFGAAAPGPPAAQGG